MLNKFDKRLQKVFESRLLQFIFILDFTLYSILLERFYFSFCSFIMPVLVRDYANVNVEFGEHFFRNELTSYLKILILFLTKVFQIRLCVLAWYNN